MLQIVKMTKTTPLSPNGSILSDLIFLGACINSSNSKIIRLIHLLLTKLMALFPTEREIKR